MSNERSAEQQKPAGKAAGAGRPEATSDATGEPEARQGEAQAPAADEPSEAGAEGRQDDAQAPAADEAPEAGVAEAAADDLRAEIERLRGELEAAQAKADDYWDRLMRTEADKENVRKRAERDVESARRYALEKFAGELLAVRDSLELGYEAANQDDADVDKLREGTELTLKMLTQAMEKFNIEEVNPVGEKFDPELHQAMSMQEAEGHETNTVISVIQKGYRLNDRLLRPALVMVAK